jgi:sugar (pentulose or hexulose) kinase
MTPKIKNAITAGKTFLGIELGSTRIKAVLIENERYAPVAAGVYEWENRWENGMWTYHLDDVWTGLRECFSQVSQNIQDLYGVPLTVLGGIGISAMMHGYLAFDKEGQLLTPFRTWRNTYTEQAASILTERFSFNIPLRWSVSHLYQAILNDENHVKDIAYLTTLAGYVHWKLTGEKVLGIGDASGMFPIEDAGYAPRMMADFETLTADRQFNWRLSDVMPKILLAGENAGVLTDEGAKLLDGSGRLQAGIPLCPPEGDAGTGMAATNSVSPRTGNVSAGTSIFAMVVLEKELSTLHREIDIVTTPSGEPVAMVHCNNGTSDLDEWVNIFREAVSAFNAGVDKNALYEALYNRALEGDADGGGLLNYNYVSGEPITGFEHGRAVLARAQGGKFSLANLMRALLFSTLGTLKIGMDILTEQEQVRLETLLGHGGFFKTTAAGQSTMAAALDIPVTVTETAGEGGPWGMALLASYMVNRAEGESLKDFLDQKVFSGIPSNTSFTNSLASDGFQKFMERFKNGLVIERAAVEAFDKKI